MGEIILDITDDDDDGGDGDGDDNDDDGTTVGMTINC
jgi:hypothetical protein